MVQRARVRALAVGVAVGLLSVGGSSVAAAATASPVDGPVTVSAIVNRSTSSRVETPTVQQFTAENAAAARDLLSRLRDDDDVVAADVDRRMTTLDSNDSYRSAQWGLTTVHAEAAWASSTGTGQIVAVVDSGSDVTHPDLAGRVLPGAEFTTQSDTPTGDGSHDDNGHGTHVSGIVAAVANNATGVAGLAPDARILPVKVLDEDGSGWTSDITRGVLWAADHGATVINLSLGSTSNSANLAAAIAYAHDVKGVVVVASAGNSGAGSNPVNYPAANAGVIAVASTTTNGVRSSFSSYGAYVDIAAPGSSILSTYPLALSTSTATAYASISGTSMASPHVAAAAALVRSRYGMSDPDAVEARLEASAVDRGPTGRDDQFGNGELDALAAVCPSALTVSPASAPSGVTASVVSGGVQVNWSAPVCFGGVRTVTYQATATPVGGGVGMQVAAGTTSALISGLPAGTYSVTVAAVNSSGSSAPSAAAQVTTGTSASAPTPTPTTTPTTAPLVVTPPTTAAPAPTPAAPTTTSTTSPPQAAPAASGGAGYLVAGADAAVASFGGATGAGSNGPLRLNQPIVGMASTRTERGYWLVARDGGIFSFGDATFLGSTGSLKLNQPIAGMTATPTGKGYWFVAADGGIFAFGDAKFFGSTGAMKLNQPIVGMAATPTGNGYWLVARDGGIFAFGDAKFFGSTGALKLNQPIVGMTATPTGRGYWFVAADGGIFSYGDATFLGSTGGARLSEPIVGMATAGLRGYWLVSGDGRVFAFGDAVNFGSARAGAVSISS